MIGDSERAFRGARMSYRVADEMDVVRFLAEEYDPWVHAVRDEPPDPDDDDFAMSLFDVTTGEFFDA